MSTKKIQMLPASVIEGMNAPAIPNAKREAAKDVRSQLIGFSKCVKHLLTDDAGKASLFEALLYQRRIAGKAFDQVALATLLKLAANKETEGITIAFVRSYASEKQREKISSGEALPVGSVITLIENIIASGTKKRPISPIGERLAAFVDVDKLPIVQAVLTKNEKVKTREQLKEEA